MTTIEQHATIEQEQGAYPGGLTAADVELVGQRLDAIREDVLASRGARDATYIRRVIAAQRLLELSGRVLLMKSRSRGAWWAGTGALTLSKVLNSMELGHNVLHGQWDWMRDPKIHSSTWDWDYASPPAQWKRAHNQTHHTYTNILGHDNDLGYGIMRVDERQPWKPRHLVQPFWNLVTACIFEYGIAMYDLDLGENVREKRQMSPAKKAELKVALANARRLATRDFVIYPALAGRGWRSTLAANATANLLRNLWSHSVIMCGHFPEGVQAFEMAELDEHETRGAWYVRQMLGSADVSGPPMLHLMTGNLSHQIEHHLFPDLPSNRYAEIAPRVRALFDQFGLPYNSRPLVRQVASAWHKVFRLSLPNGWLAETDRRNLLPQLGRLVRMAREGRASQRQVLQARQA